MASTPIADLMRQRTGALTQELVQEPARFGLGKVPARLQPDNTTDSVCGFCSTGCSLTVHLREGHARQRERRDAAEAHLSHERSAVHGHLH